MLLQSFLKGPSMSSQLESYLGEMTFFMAFNLDLEALSLQIGLPA